MISDYFIQLVAGLNWDEFVPGAEICAYESRKTEYDWLHTAYFLGQPGQTQEATTFNITHAISNNFPDFLFACHDIPRRAVLNWGIHFDSFPDSDDFGEAFIQNVVGNVITFSDIYQKTKEAGAAEDYLTVTYETGRFIRRLLDFEPTEQGALKRASQANRGFRPFQKQLRPELLAPYRSNTWFAYSVAITAGLIDGAFGASSTYDCMTNLYYVNYNTTSLLQAF